MNEFERLVEDFLSQNVIAVVGVSDRRETGCGLNYRVFKESGYRVYPVSPRLTSYNGDPCYPDLQSVPEKPDAVFILARPIVSEEIVGECIELGIKRVWMHCMFGTKAGLTSGSTSVSPAAVEMCRMNGIAVIPGSCPAQMLKSDLAHSVMGRLLKMLGFMKAE